MHLFWHRFILPLLLAAKPKRVMEIGAEFGWNTPELLALGKEHGLFVDIIDPCPHPAFHEELARFEGGYAFHPAKSLDVIHLLPAPDFVLLDGDHNWYTVFNELNALYLRAEQLGGVPPIIMMHDVAWPYARRDMYYDPKSIIDPERQPYAYRGLVPGDAGLRDDGINGNFANALQEGGGRNGVLTAVEDFLAASRADIAFHRLPFFNGLGILIPRARATEAVTACVASFFSPASLLESCEALELDGMNVRVELHRCQQLLTQRTEALMRARTLIAELQQQLHGRETV